MGNAHKPGCKIDHELVPMDGSEPEPCGVEPVIEGDTSVTYVFEPEPGIIVDSRGAFIPAQRVGEWCRRVQGLLG